MPSGFQPNDILIVAVAVSGGTGATITAPSGWYTQSTMNISQSTNTRLTIYYRVATGYESASYSWTFDTTRSASAFMVAYEGANPFYPPAIATQANATASTTINVTDTNSTYETGRQLQIVVCNNTTAVSTLTAGSGYTNQVDICTTASPFIEICLLDGAKGVPMGGLSSSSPTCSQSVTGVFANIFIEDQRPAFNKLGEDEFVIGSFSTSRTSLASQVLQANYPNELLLAMIGIQNGTTTVSSVTGASLTWSLVARANTNAGSSEVWCAFSPNTFSSQPITITFSGATVSGNILLAGIVGADMTTATGLGAIGATATGTSSAAAPTISLTTTRNNSWVWSIMNEGMASASSISAGTNQTNIRSVNDTTNAAASWILRQNSLTTTKGTNVTMNATAPSTDSCNIVAIEILPTIQHALGSLGAGAS